MRTPFLAVMLFAALGFAPGLRADDAALSVSIPINLCSDMPGGYGNNGDWSLASMDVTSVFHVVITNVSDKPQKVFDDGDQLSFIFTDAHGKKWTCEHHGESAVEKPRGVWWSLEPHDTLVIDVNFKDPGWHGFPVQDGEVFAGTIQAVFSLRNNEPVTVRDGATIWTGRVVSNPKLIRFYPDNTHGSWSGDHKDWKLVWEDDFSKDGGQIDPKKWSFKIDGQGNGNHESQYYTGDPKNAHIQDGVLVITALKEDKGWAHYTSSELCTQGLYGVKFGRIEASIKVPPSQAGNWPAFWMMPDDGNKSANWQSGAIDIMEMVNDAKGLHGTIHFGWGMRAAGPQISAPNGDFSTDYHVYGVEWEPDKFMWFLDHRSYGPGTDWGAPKGPVPAPFNQPFYIILNFALGGDWPNNAVSGQHRRLPDADAKFPESMSVKWVRVYQPQ
jgi:beta-glucanase (GH16 family)